MSDMNKLADQAVENRKTVLISREAIKKGGTKLVRTFIEAIGGLVIYELLKRGGIAFFFNENDVLELATLEEVALDGLPEDEAIGKLIDKSKSNEDIRAYLVGRKARLGL